MNIADWLRLVLKKVNEFTDELALQDAEYVADRPQEEQAAQIAARSEDPFGTLHS